MRRKPFLQFLTQGKQHAAKHAVLLHKRFQLSPLGRGTPRMTDVHLSRETMLRQMGAHFADALVSRERHVRNGLMGNQHHEPVARCVGTAAGCLEAVAPPVVNQNQPLFGELLQRGPDCRATHLKHIAQPPLARERLRPGVAFDRLAHRGRDLRGQRKSPRDVDASGLTGHKNLPVERCRFCAELKLDSLGMNVPSKVPIWSAVPTPLTPDLKVDVASVARMVAAAVSEGIEGLFIAGTCGEGPWLPDRERRRLMDAAVHTAAGRLKIAAQVSDNSVPRILDNAAVAAKAGVDFAIIASPAIMLNATPERIVAHFTEAATECPLPVGIYDLGRHRSVMIPEDSLKAIYLLPQVHFVKDSSGSPERRACALAAPPEKPKLR